MPLRTAVSLFAGVGGFDLALERNGYKVTSAAEIDKHARGILSRRFPDTHIYDDVRKVSGDGLRADGFISDGGIITGGFPCQDLSVAGKRAGLAGARSGLFYEIARIADESQAEWLVLENVPGLLSSQRGADMGAVVGTLVDLGYGVAWRVLDAQHFGVPQRRRRVFIVARRAGDPTSAAQVLFERQSLRGDSSTGRTQGEETAGTVGESSAKPVLLTMREGKPGGGKGPLISEDMSLTLATGNGQVLIEPTIYEPNRRDGVKRAQSATDDESWREDTVTPTLNQFDTGDTRATVVAIQGSVVGRNDASGPGGKGHGEIGDPMFTLNTTDRHAIATTGNGGDVMNTIPASIYHHGTMVNQDVNSGLMVLTQTVRRLTPLECERLQGFPDGWTEGQADSHRYKQMGNAVAVPVVEWVIRGIVEAQ